MSKKDDNSFYIGYQPRGPAAIMRFVSRGLIFLALVVLSVSLIVVFGQRPFTDGFFDFGNVQDFDGYVMERPVPMLVAEKNGAAGSLPMVRNYVLVGEGKHGAESTVKGLNGKAVRLRGTLIRRDGIEMIEVADGSVQTVSPESKSFFYELKVEGRYTLTGEIVDSKCYLGVMNPGQSKPHRACASLCIRGGIPPIFVVRDADGRALHLWLLSANGTPVNQAILDFVAEPVEITGTLDQVDDKQYFLIDPTAIRRLSRD